ncbi:hypothetical protein GCM10023196_009860 [Actinoallomurus vinaceus]|uniref:Anti-sigma-D factor RsdA sigma factor binding region domain-containing protein n=1 Tax=Actinoallomurus vinaceus TaxID=1080074 RepID=A0ABP8U5A2_9ACTN
MTGGGTATPEPLDLSEISRSGDLFDALAGRRVTDPGAGFEPSDDPAARLLAALIADVDVDAPPLPAPPPRVSCGGSKTSGRPVVRAFVTFGAVTVLLTTAGAAVAGGGGDREPKAHAPLARIEASERSKAHLESVVRAFPGGPRPSVGRTPAASPRPSETKTSEAPTKPPAGAPAKGHTPGYVGPKHPRGHGPDTGHSTSPSPTPTPTAPADPTPSPSTSPTTSKPSGETSATDPDRSRRTAKRRSSGTGRTSADHDRR